ncbi:hypothetical protein GUJ93_ZPchr0002g26336 [Zizania palustris]|uniref:Uncharacterized protein n=1 Tax=Zizania palustris TaxID=103762 RepID=A0A8J5VV45_ZIZPA|nr:hypothetical protein GUJ93_ZPchr0002g26336 [Zizania palustris]
MARSVMYVSSGEVERIMEKPGAGGGGGGTPPPPRLDCIKCCDALWFCYSPYHQMQSYYRSGEFDSCFGKWGDLIDCLSLKTKRRAEVEEILLARERDSRTSGPSAPSTRRPTTGGGYSRTSSSCRRRRPPVPLPPLPVRRRLPSPVFLER